MTEKKKQRIDQTLRNLAANTSKATTPNTSSTEGNTAPGRKTAERPLPGQVANYLPGDPACPKCGGLGYLRQDLPLGHPDFGKIRICDCRSEQVNREARRRLFALSNLDELGHLTFENFSPRGRVGLTPRQAGSLEYAYNHAQQYAQNVKGWLVLQGGFGCGKTHLAAAIANFVVRLGVPTLFITAPDLLDSLRFSYDSPEATFEQRFEEIRTAPFLVLDDFGTQNATNWATEKLFQILNYRYINHLPMVVTTNLDVRDLDERIASRLMDPDLVTTVHILSPDFRNPANDFGHPELSSLDLLHRCTFASFDLLPRPGMGQDELASLKTAFTASRRFAEHPRGWLVLTGSYGAGKTHLAAAIANYRTDVGEPPLFVVVPDLLDHLRATFSPNSSTSLDRRFEEVRMAPLLVLDDLGMQSSTPWAREKLYQLFNYRYNAEMPTVITTSTPLADMDPRLRSRMLDTRLVEIYALTAPPYTGRSSSNGSDGIKPRRPKGKKSSNNLA